MLMKGWKDFMTDTCAECHTPLPEIDFCSACNEHADWRYDDDEWLSACCSARPVEVDPT